MIPLLEYYKERWHVQSERVIKPGLAAIKQALERLNNPQNALSVVHFAGTNGKGSTLTFVEQIARQHGLTVGKFMSPCIVDIHDQIQINGHPIESEQLDGLFQQLEKAGLSGKLTDFELLTVIAFLYFKQQNVDLVLLEAGMGGREDSTNVVEPIVSIIPSIALEHTNFLGTTLMSIATHKAGIIKANKPVIIGGLPEEAEQVIIAEALQQQAKLLKLGRDFDVYEAEQGEVYENAVQHLVIPALQRQLPGQHQAQNMALAITAFFEVAKALNVSPVLNKVQAGVQNATVPGRFEQVLPNLYFDGAHNPASIRMLVDTIKQQFPGKRIEFVLGILADKDVEAVLRILEEVGDAFYFVNLENERAMKAAYILQLSRAKEKEIIADEQSFLREKIPQQTIRFVTGSLYLLSEIRLKLK
ncbi:bifunctional folylpolyglutamate synthase/dihydrofolate synthase [Solibacillus sp. R5-41]|uniref:bifunctional folylpolyglutamate synthase/dihydrofolate synthase n=1 Tax=Solibacillus sp. R5-41 TaxID=2048654 RepID=UPI000C126F98|nr:folylpolyglutamate synthase/dihydrofolate synthase family protein [Solibacillus sp. R5-41]ATP41280.1 bifunctional folylpolyglutamate synthase/dihydrofolate synthase [Solibacillus sp. R5-41]